MKFSDIKIVFLTYVQNHINFLKKSNGCSKKITELRDIRDSVISDK